MAVHDDVDGIEVSVLIDGQVAKEYDTENDDSTHANGIVRIHEERWTVTKYIESISEATFSVKVAAHPWYQMLSPRIGFEVFVDGVRAREPLAKQSDVFTNAGFLSEIKGMETRVYGGNGVLRRFKFSKIETKSDGANSAQIKEQTNRMSKVGEIAVKVYRYDLGMDSLGQFDVGIPDSLTNNYGGGIHEKALKGQAKSHGTALGAAEPHTISRHVRCQKIDGDEYPFVIFKFKYRSNEALKQLLVIERTPEPEPDLLDGLTAEERQEIQDLAERLRRKRRNPGAEDDGFIKTEDGKFRGGSGGAVKKVRKSGKKVTIDLTRDSDEDDDYESPIELD